MNLESLPDEAAEKGEVANEDVDLVRSTIFKCETFHILILPTFYLPFLVSFIVGKANSSEAHVLIT